MMNAKRVYQIMIGVLVLLNLLIIGTTFVGNKLLEKQSKKLYDAKLESGVLEKEQVNLDQAKTDLKKYAELNNLSKQIVPSDKDQAKTVREIVSIANDSGVSIASIGFPASDLGAKATSSSSDSSSGPKINTNAISQAKPVSGIDGLSQLDINVASDTTRLATYNQLISFLEQLENNRRTSQVTSLTIQPSTKDHSLLSFSLTVTVYIKP